MKEYTNDSIAAHYDTYDTLYKQWSGECDGGYHFGVMKLLRDFFSNATMVRNMSEMMIGKITRGDRSLTILDAGCGSGHIGRMIEADNPHDKMYGVTLSQTQVDHGKTFTREGGSKQLLYNESFERTHFEKKFFDVILFVESICYGKSADKAKALAESARIIKPGGQIIISDVFLQESQEERSAWFSFVNKKVCALWKVNEWAQEDVFLSEMTAQGFAISEVQDVTYRIVPSAFHILMTKLPRTAWSAIFAPGENKEYAKQFKYFLLVGIFVPLLGLHPTFRYKIITAKRTT